MLRLKIIRGTCHLRSKASGGWMICVGGTGGISERCLLHVSAPSNIILQRPLWYPFETCIFNRVWFMAKSGSEIARNIIPILWISQRCLNRGLSQCIPTRVIFGFLVCYQYLTDFSIWLTKTHRFEYKWILTVSDFPIPPDPKRFSNFGIECSFTWFLSSFE
jgi:hypothetical protein